MHPPEPQGVPFEDIIDGYFPLRVSLGQMMDRLGAARAFVELSHAPIMQIPGLSHEAPVPLNIRAGRAGIVERLALWVDRDPNGGLCLGGSGVWRWLDGDLGAPCLDPNTRLAEPAFVVGRWYGPDPEGAGIPGKITRS